jgi:RecJ-like exonuclease
MTRFCIECDGTGRNPETKYRCDYCGGTGKHSLFSGLAPVVAVLVSAAIVLYVGYWIHALVSR